METKKPSLSGLFNKANSGSKHAVFCGDLLHCRDIIHLNHWKTKGTGSFAAHEALGDLYDALQDHADDITELIQSYTGVLNITVPASTAEEPLSYLKKFRTNLISHVKLVESDMPDVSNTIQDLLADVSKTIYKLENLA